MNIESTTYLCPQEARIPWYERSHAKEIFLFFGIALLAGNRRVTGSFDSTNVMRDYDYDNDHRHRFIANLTF
jgi:hypothetical protein